MRVHRARGAFVASRSAHDASVNWAIPADPGLIEARYVRRAPDYFAAYLSSQTGCQQACRMCHLTASKQTRLRDVTLTEFLAQADVVLAHAATQPQAERVHFNFMARGEPLSNPVVLEQSAELLDALWRRASERGLRARFLVSTLMPRALERPLEQIFDRYQPELYYSLYSMDEAVRRRWLPRALPAGEALDRLAAWQRQSYKLVKLHFALIEGVNDAPRDIHAICDAVLARDLQVHVNLVRYNPPSPAHGREPPERVLEASAKILRERLRARVRVVPRVGVDVHASCGMFQLAGQPE